MSGLRKICAVVVGLARRAAHRVFPFYSHGEGCGRKLPRISRHGICQLCNTW
jgi:hypothetical protein